jgi:hypothetical protein
MRDTRALHRSGEEAETMRKTLVAVSIVAIFGSIAGVASAYWDHGFIVTQGTFIPSCGQGMWIAGDGCTADFQSGKKDPSQTAKPWTLKFKALFGNTNELGPYTVSYKYWSDPTPNATWPTCSLSMFFDGTVVGRSGSLAGAEGVHEGQFQTTTITPGRGSIVVKVACKGKPDQFTMHWDLLNVDP